MGVERVEQGTQDSTLWGSYVQSDGVGGELADFHHLWSGGEEILNPVTECFKLLGAFLKPRREHIPM